MNIKVGSEKPWNFSQKDSIHATLSILKIFKKFAYWTEEEIQKELGLVPVTSYIKKQKI